MARVSFTLRRSVIDRGSYARYDASVYNTAASAGNAASAGTWIADDPLGTRDNDTSLRSDGYQLPPINFTESFLEAYAVTYDTVQINWTAPLTDIDVSPVPTQTVLVYSPYGPVATISSGTILSESSTEFSITQTNLQGGESGWAYYTLFVRYQSTGGDDYYEPVANVEVLVPYNYGSTSLLWERIPEHYRIEDERLGIDVDPTSAYAINDLGALPAGNKVGPLFKFLSVFGFEMDRTRTLIDYLMVSRDPSLANTENLNALAEMMGVGLSSDLINASRVRAVLDDIGYLRRSKGNMAGITAYGRALSGCEIEIDASSKEITVYSQRINYMTDPRDATGMVTSRPAHASESLDLLTFQGGYDPTTYNPADPDTFPPTLAETYEPGMYWTSASAGTFKGIPIDAGDYIAAYETSTGDVEVGVCGYFFDADNYTSYNTYSSSGPLYTANGSGVSDGVTHVMLHIDCPIPVKTGDSVYFSVHSGIGASALKWARLVDSSGNVIGQSVGLTRAGDHPAAEIPATQNVTQDWTIAFVELLIDLEAVTNYSLSSILTERNRLGAYFDGDSNRGGWLIDPTGTTVSDFRWSSEGENNGNPYESISVYTEDYQRTRALLNRVFRQALPITQEQYYTIVATDAIPGQSAIDTYLTTP
jgi:hypothetical protein